MRDPEGILSPLFFEDLKETLDKHHKRVLLCFDNFEQTRKELQDWLLKLREYKPQRVRLMIASRSAPGTRWDYLHRITQTIHLNAFTDMEAEAFLNSYQIFDAQRRAEIKEASERLPVMMSWMATALLENEDSAVPVKDLIDRYLRWDTDNSFRRVLLTLAFPLTFNQDILQVLYPEVPADKIEYLFNQVIEQPYVQEKAEGKSYHPIIRTKMLEHIHHLSPQLFADTHTRLAQYYAQQREKYPRQWRSKTWRTLTLSYVYHWYCADPENHWIDIMNLFAIALYEQKSFAQEILQRCQPKELEKHIPHTQHKLIHSLLKSMEEAGEQPYYTSEMLHTLSRMQELSSHAHACLTACLGIRAYGEVNYAQAIDYFTQAIASMPEENLLLFGRGLSFYFLQQYDNALSDFNLLLSLEPNDTGALLLRGLSFYYLEQYDNALSDFNLFLSLEPNHAGALFWRGTLYREMGEYEKALHDLNAAIALGYNCYQERGLIHSYLGKYEEALADYTQALADDPGEAGILYNIAVVLVRYKGPDEAAQALSEARAALLQLQQEEKGSALYGLGGLEALQGNHEQALSLLREAFQEPDTEPRDWVRHDIAWRDLRNHPDFQKLVYDEPAL
ncbi:tetratricopeptide repeat protein [Thermosporothrix hazakensis]|jgi:tetratricopeptide (TPR) repeat protein|uniref:Tetratricopeptide repeat protein n=2 Tax=Thermosporothrix TaxID=768650 RepID=A0A326UDI8_THEHA|nr:tetratricopeptide repeat protein [Thermosporothrix hazakensis]PZW24045.1 tetratricopeptide repeat protein [Thermosporothrix hazakensis]BBH87831.1 hypothetical protein KTC_25820 [Thermosporothrix sp. COM3]GCE50259.1 hypothetical protein KTH_51280 [Thermosporothrix hazakensis]